MGEAVLLFYPLGWWCLKVGASAVQTRNGRVSASDLVSVKCSVSIDSIDSIPPSHSWSFMAQKNGGVVPCCSCADCADCGRRFPEHRCSVPWPCQACGCPLDLWLGPNDLPQKSWAKRHSEASRGLFRGGTDEIRLYMVILCYTDEIRFRYVSICFYMFNSWCSRNFWYALGMLPCRDSVSKAERFKHFPAAKASIAPVWARHFLRAAGLPLQKDLDMIQNVPRSYE